MIIALGQELLNSNIYDEDSIVRSRIRNRIELILKSLPADSRCLGKYKNGISMDFCQICANMNILQEVIIPYEDNDNSWPIPIKSKFADIVKKSKKTKLLHKGGFNPKKLKDMDAYASTSSDIIINITINNGVEKITLVAKNEYQIPKSLFNKLV
jgi:hypothetical protein